MTEPEKNQSGGPFPNGRDARGRFALGEYEGGPGRPAAGRSQRDRALRVFRDLISADGYSAIKVCFEALLREAREGNVPAAKLILEYGCGRPDQDGEFEERLKRLELTLMEGEHERN